MLLRLMPYSTLVQANVQVCLRGSGQADSAQPAVIPGPPVRQSQPAANGVIFLVYIVNGVTL